MKICIGGLGSSGKTSIGEMLSKELNIEHISESYKKSANGDEDLLSMLKKLQKDKDTEYAKKFDNEIIKKAEGKDCVITTWLSPWLVKDATLRIWIEADIEERARRRAKLNGMNYADALKFIEVYDKTNAEYFKGLYGIDIHDHSIFDASLNNGKLTQKQIIEVIALLALEKDGKRFR